MHCMQTGRVATSDTLAQASTINVPRLCAHAHARPYGYGSDGGRTGRGKEERMHEKKRHGNRDNEVEIKLQKNKANKGIMDTSNPNTC